MTDALTLDGNGIAGLLGEIAAAEMTTVLRTCQSCGDRQALGAHRAYRGAGVVLRCPSCGDVAVRIVVREDRLVVDWRGSYEITR
jgi:predicted RNA-binding Zn-ribbon protein involved in translation (DUF1610 family)